MLVGLIVAAVAALALAVAVIVLRRRLRDAATLLVDAERRLVLADERAETAESAARASDARRTTAEERTAALEAELSVARTEIDTAQQARDAARDRAADIEAAGDRLIEAAALRADTGGLWFLDAVRVERHWRATTGTGSSLFDGEGEPSRLALEAVCEVVKEESGTSFDVEWLLADAIPPGLALAVVRASEELLSSLAVSSDGGVLEVSDVGGAVRLLLRVDPEPMVPVELLAVFDVLGWEVGIDHRSPPCFTLTIPYAGPDSDSDSGSGSGSG